MTITVLLITPLRRLQLVLFEVSKKTFEKKSLHRQLMLLIKTKEKRKKDVKAARRVAWMVLPLFATAGGKGTSVVPLTRLRKWTATDKSVFVCKCR